MRSGDYRGDPSVTVSVEGTAEAGGASVVWAGDAHPTGHLSCTRAATGSYLRVRSRRGPPPLTPGAPMRTQWPCNVGDGRRVAEEGVGGHR
jgi:hypothetical protein